MKHMDVVIVGAGFAGLMCAEAAAAQGLKVLVIDRKKNIRHGIHTTGILVEEAADFLQPPEKIVHKITRVELMGASRKGLQIQHPSYTFYATDTGGLMEHMRDRAVAAGATVQMDTPFTDTATMTKDSIILPSLDAETKFLVGCDGARSAVAKHFGLGQNQKFLLGAELELEGHVTHDSSMFTCIVDQRFARGYLGWIVPSVGITQIGVATANVNEKIDSNAFLKSVSSVLNTDTPNIVARRGGLIPVGGRVENFANERVILCGDAAGIVSPLTAGGIHTGLVYGRMLGGLLANHILKDGVHPAVPLRKAYPKFLIKQGLRHVYEHVPNFVLDAIIRTACILPVANQVFFTRNERSA